MEIRIYCVAYGTDGSFRAVIIVIYCYLTRWCGELPVFSATYSLFIS